MTLRAQELRIGNYVLDGQDLIKIHSISENAISFLYEEKPAFLFVNEISGIPLTTEWLERFGFEPNGVFKSMRLAMDDLNRYGARTFIVVAYDGEAWIEIISRDVHNNYKESQSHVFQLKYLHQLQNLYFALTGDELTINT